MRLGSLLLLAILVAGACFVTAPWWAFRSLRDAARTGDVPSLSKLVDYPAVRQSLGDQLAGRKAEDQAPPPSVFTDPIGAIKHAFTPPPPELPQVEAYVSPRGLADLTAGKSPGQPLPRREPFPVIAFWGPDRCRITVADPDAHGRKTEFTFQRRGVFDWKLTRILLPPKAARPAKPRTARKDKRGDHR